MGGAGALFVPGSTTMSGEDIFDMPTMGEGKSSELNYAELRDLIWRCRPSVVFVEKLTAFPQKDPITGEITIWGATSMAKMMGTYYATRAVVGCLEIPLREFMPAEWKAAFNLRGGGKNKEDSRMLAVLRYPHAAEFLKRKKDAGRAEALLIAAYGARKVSREEENLVIPD